MRAKSLWQRKVVWRWWSLENRCKGFKYGPIQRHRCCDHTTPSHYAWCKDRP